MPYGRTKVGFWANSIKLYDKNGQLDKATVSIIVMTIGAQNQYASAGDYCWLLLESEI
ncbi:MAG: hypothetical protein U0103_23865 [Candidatus Obscuribacterales bacterium]